jgi:L-asparaginase
MKKILVCFSGGTFSSKTKDNIMDLSDKVNDEFITNVTNIYHGEVNFKFLNTTLMLSENMYPEVWEKITDDINNVLKEDRKLDGIILIHGSDTAAYTTTFLSHYYKNLPIPIVVTASNAPIGESNSNGLNNFNASVDFILTSKLRGTYFIFQANQNRGEKLIYKAAELLEANVYTGEFMCSQIGAFGKIQNRKFVSRESNEKNKNKKNLWEFEKFEYKNKILGIKPYTGLDYSFFDLDSRNIKAVVHGAYHSSTQNCNTDSGYGDYSIIEFIEKCEKLGIDVYLSDFPQNRLLLPIYETTAKLIRLGAMPVYNPFECAYTKAIHVYNNSRQDKKEFMMR